MIYQSKIFLCNIVNNRKCLCLLMTAQPFLSSKEEVKSLIPPIHGVIVIPGNIAFLNQFFSVVLQATNVGPEGSGLIVENTRATIVLPPGDEESLDVWGFRDTRFQLNTDGVVELYSVPISGGQ